MHLLRSFKIRSSCYQQIILTICLFFVGAIFGFFSMAQTIPVSATEFNPGNIISDAVMANYNSMSINDIQNFLTSKNPCNNRNYALYLEQSTLYKSVTWHWSDGHFVCLSEERFGDNGEIGQGQTAAEIIYQAAQEYRINPQVLIVLLEKEQGLVSDTYPHSGQYRAATGYGCPDTAACDSRYYGFKNQVFRAAELFRYTLDHGSSLYPDNRNGVYVAYNPSSSCGGTSVYIENRATSALYRYTPYQPNAAALAAGYGMGDSCSAYGNRNFYLYFTDWFGSTQSIQNSNSNTTTPQASTIKGSMIAIPEGEYILTPQVSSQRSLGVSASNAQLSNYSESDKSQHWRIQFAGDINGTYQYHLINSNSGQYLTAVNSNSGANVQTSAYSGQCNQRWTFYRTSDGYMTLESGCAKGMILDVFGAYNTAGTNIQLWLSHNGAAQKWHLQTGRTTADGLYLISALLNSNIVLDVTGANTTNGTNVEAWSSHGGLAQRWYVAYHPDRDAYTITNPNSGKNLNLNGSPISGTNVTIQSPNSSCSQYWKILINLDGSRSLLSTCQYGYPLTATALSNGGNIELATARQDYKERWNFQTIAQPVSNGTYNIVSRKTSNLALDVTGAGTHNGVNVEVWDNHGGIPQQWNLTYNSLTDDYTIIDKNSGKALDLNDGVAISGKNITIWARNNGCNQRWRLVSTSNNYYKIASSCNSRYVVDIYGGFTTRGTNIQLWQDLDGVNQQWKFVAR